jgi:competence protein ComEC
MGGCLTEYHWNRGMFIYEKNQANYLMMKNRFYILLVLLIVQVHCYSTSWMIKCGHSDSYLIKIAEYTGVIDAGSGSTSLCNCLIQEIKNGTAKLDFVIITHWHLDHYEGLFKAFEFAKMNGIEFKIGKLVSNHDKNGIKMLIGEIKFRELLTHVNPGNIIEMNGKTFKKIILSNENGIVEVFNISNNSRYVNENNSGLMAKVTEIRDGEKAAILFLGDMEKSKQLLLFSNPNFKKEILKYVRAVTIPHHGRKGTLTENFFENIELKEGPKTIFLHSDREPPNIDLALKVPIENVISTAKNKSDVIPIPLGNKFENAYYEVKDKPKDLSDIVLEKNQALIKEKNYTFAEVVEVVCKYCGRLASVPLPVNTLISWPSDDFINKEISKKSKDLIYQKSYEPQAQDGYELKIYEPGRLGVNRAKNNYRPRLWRIKEALREHPSAKPTIIFDWNQKKTIEEKLKFKLIKEPPIKGK